MRTRKVPSYTTGRKNEGQGGGETSREDRRRAVPRGRRAALPAFSGTDEKDPQRSGLIAPVVTTASPLAENRRPLRPPLVARSPALRGVPACR